MTIIIIQARLTSTRLPGKVLIKISGKSIISRVCKAARDAKSNKVVVAWAHKFPHLDENDVLGRFREIVLKYKPDVVVRLTSDCPLLRYEDVNHAIYNFHRLKTDYFSNHMDGYDVQVFKPEILWTKGIYDKEHVIADFTTPKLGWSVDTLENLLYVAEILSIRES